MVFKTKPDASVSASPMTPSITRQQAVVASTQPVSSSSSFKHLKAWSGGTLLLAGLGIMATTLWEVDDLQTISDPVDYNAQLLQEKNRLQTQYALGWVGVGLGTTLLALWLFDDSSSSSSLSQHKSSSSHHLITQSKNTSKKPLFLPLLSPEQAGMSVYWSF